MALPSQRSGREPTAGRELGPEQEAVWELEGCRLCFPGSKPLRKHKLEECGLEAHMERVGIGGSMKTFLQSECLCPSGIILVSNHIILLSNAQMMKVNRVSGASHR